jgi:hypothetical protein
MKKGNTLKPVQVAVVAFSLFFATLTTVFALTSTKTDHQLAIENQAKVVFQLDSTKKALFPSSDVVALSVAIGFKDYHGAEKILQKLGRI